MDKSIKGASKSFSKSVKHFSNIEGMNIVLFVVVIAMILNAKMLRPMVSNMPGKLALILFICFLATADRVLGLLGVVLFMAVNNCLIEGHEDEEKQEGMDHEEDKDNDGTGEEMEGMDHEGADPEEEPK